MSSIGNKLFSTTMNNNNNNLGLFTHTPSPKQFLPLPTNKSKKITVSFNYRSVPQDKKKCRRSFRIATNSVHLQHFLTSDDESQMSNEFLNTIEELEHTSREPSDILEQMTNKLSPRELQLVLVYFAQEGRDSWCALEVFEWLRKENRVDKETMELMVSIMCSWVKKLVEGGSGVGDVVELLVDMDCVGLKTGFSMVEKVVGMYWEAGMKEECVLFVEEVLRRGGVVGLDVVAEGSKGGPAGYLAWKMMVICSFMFEM